MLFTFPKERVVAVADQIFINFINEVIRTFWLISFARPLNGSLLFRFKHGQLCSTFKTYMLQ